MKMKSTHTKKEMYQANARDLQLGPNPTYISLTCIGCFTLEVMQILKFGLGVTQVLEFLDTNMLVYPTQNFALGVLANARTQCKCFCVAVDYL